MKIMSKNLYSSDVIYAKTVTINSFSSQFFPFSCPHDFVFVMKIRLEGLLNHASVHDTRKRKKKSYTKVCYKFS